MQQNCIHTRKAGGKPLSIWYNMKVWILNEPHGGTPFRHRDLKVICPISKRFRKLNRARQGEQWGAWAPWAIQCLQRGWDAGSLIPLFKSDWEREFSLALGVNWYLLPVLATVNEVSGQWWAEEPRPQPRRPPQAHCTPPPWLAARRHPDAPSQGHCWHNFLRFPNQVANKVG